MAREMFAKPRHSVNEWGFGPGDFAPVEIWPDTLPAHDVLAVMSTQWRVGPGGPYGIDYGFLQDARRHVGVSDADWPQVFDDFRLMESAAIEELHEK